MSDRLASVLRRRGISPGDRVAATMPSTPRAFQWALGILKAGAVLVPLDAHIKEAELKRILRAFGVTLLVQNDALLKPPPPPAPENSSSARTRGHAPALIWLTSGSCDKPKGVVVSHAALLARFAIQRKRFGQDETQRSLCVLPLAFGLVHPCLSTFSNGGTVILCPPFDVDVGALPLLWERVARFKATTILVVPTLVRLLLELRQRGAPPRCLRCLYCVGAPLAPAEADAFKAAYGIPVLNCYGLKETGPIALADYVCGGDAAILDGEGRPLPAGSIGEVAFHGASLALGYCLPRGVDTSAFKSGWFRTGDLGSVAGDGHLTLSGRLREVIIRNGVKISPEEVEAELRRCEGVVDAAVLGVPDALMGERVAACVVRREGYGLSHRDLLAHCRGRLTDHKCPQRFKFVTRIPRTALGKVERRALEALLRR